MAAAFPREAIEAILEYSREDDRTIRTCALINKTWLHVGQKYIFASLDWTNTMDRLRHHAFHRFVKLSVKYPSLPSYVIRLRIAFGCHPAEGKDEPELHLDVQEELPLILAKMRNLRCLTVQGTVTRLVASCLGGIGFDFSSLPDEPREALFRIIKSDKLRALNFKHIRNLPMAEICSSGTFTHLGLVRCGFVPLDNPDEEGFLLESTSTNGSKSPSGRSATPPPPSASRVITSLTLSTRDIEAFTHIRHLSDGSGRRRALLDLTQVSSIAIASTANKDTEWKTSLWTHISEHMSESLENLRLFPSKEGLIEARVLDDTILDLGKLPNLKSLYWHTGNTMVVGVAVQSPLSPFVTTLQTAKPENIITDLYLNLLRQNVGRVPSMRDAPESSDWKTLDSLFTGGRFQGLKSVVLYLPDSFQLQHLARILPKSCEKGIVRAVTDPDRARDFDRDTVF